jgi:hypothetical protein
VLMFGSHPVWAARLVEMFGASMRTAAHTFILPRCADSVYRLVVAPETREPALAEFKSGRFRAASPTPRVSSHVGNDAAVEIRGIGT